MLGGKVVHDLAVGARLSFEATEKILFSQEEMNPLIGIRPRLEHQYPFCIEKKKIILVSLCPSKERMG